MQVGRITTLAAGSLLALAAGTQGAAFYEGFNYTEAVGTELASVTSSSGTGFSSGWASVTGSNSGQLGTDLATGGRSWEDSKNNATWKNQRPFSNASDLFDDNETHWFSFLAKFPQRNNTTTITFGAEVDGANNSGFSVAFTSSALRITVAGNQTNGAANSLLTQTDSTYLVVGRLINVAGASNDTVDVWFNPTATTEATLVATAPTLSKSDRSVSASGSYLILDGGGGARTIYDEIRLGESFNAVVPEPTSLSALALGSALLIRRRLNR